jgi:uncharacterized protein (TIGR01777 family)
MQSRIDGTGLLRRTIERSSERPAAFVSASGIHYYGYDVPAPADESAPAGTGFLAEVCKAWEREARTDATRSVSVRTALVLSPEGGALKRMLLPAKLGLGGPIAGGDQWWSWVSIDDIVGTYVHAAFESSREGAMNGAAPDAIRQRDFAAVLGAVLHRPAVIPLPRWAVRIVLGEMGEHLLPHSINVTPAVLAAEGYRWRHPTLEAALRSMV